MVSPHFARMQIVKSKNGLEPGGFTLKLKCGICKKIVKGAEALHNHKYDEHGF